MVPDSKVPVGFAVRRTMGVAVEACCGGLDDAIAAALAGASRIELNSGLALGGLTPSPATLRLVKAKAGPPVVCMVRPRGAGFSYSGTEFAQMKAEAYDLLEAGADGIAFGFLTPDRQVDLDRTRLMAALAHSFGAEAVFHRAFDVAVDPLGTAAALAEAGVDRLLTSGQAATALEGAPLVARLQADLGGRLQILAGGGVRAGSVGELVAATGVRQVHASCRGLTVDPTTCGDAVSYAYLGDSEAPCHDHLDVAQLSALVSRTRQLG